MPMAARLTDPVAHPAPPMLTPGPGSPTVLIGGLPAWRCLPAAMAAAVEAASQAAGALATAPQMTPVDATAMIANMSSAMGQMAAAAGSQGAPQCGGAASGAMGGLNGANAGLAATWATASVAPGGQPAANIAYTEGIRNAAGAAAAAAFSCMAGLADMHACTTPIPAHGPGFVTRGSPDVFVNGLPLARQFDRVIEAAGPPNPIVMGCPTVIVN